MTVITEHGGRRATGGAQLAARNPRRAATQLREDGPRDNAKDKDNDNDNAGRGTRDDGAGYRPGAKKCGVDGPRPATAAFDDER